MQAAIRFNGADYDPARDNPRLTNQLHRVFDCMRDAQWRTLAEIEQITGEKSHNRRQLISDELDYLDNLEALFGWTYRIAQDRALLRRELASLHVEDAAVSRALQEAGR